MTTNDTLDTVLSGFAKARGVEADEEWAAVAATRMTLDDVNQDLARDGLAEALELVRQTQESPEELFGDAREWARSQVKQWRVDGEPVEPLEPDTSWRLVPTVSAVTAAIISVVLLVALMLGGEWRFDYTWGALLLPTIAALTTVVGLTVFEHTLERARRLLAAGAALLVVAAGVALMTTLFMVGNDHPIGEGSLWWFGVLAMVHAAVAWLFAKVIPDAPRRGIRGPLPDDEWERQVAGILRLRVELPEGRVRQHLEEAKAHAAQSGRSLHEEFGAPNSYASRFPRDRGSAERRRLWLYTAVVPVSAYLAFGEVVVSGGDWSLVSWPFVLVLALVIWATVSGWLAVARRRPGGQDESLSTSSARP
ncbi:hypothetical protein [Ornithinimicrobium panacihumi]|uniref:hypothetical protein n=1 Tax=Ornithinimicrobium panacihumi TaxID=2008449 RepID=UPI003F8A9F70